MARTNVVPVIESPEEDSKVALDVTVGRQLSLELARPPGLSTRPFRAEITLEQQSLFVADDYVGDSFVREVVVRHPTTGEPVVTRLFVGQMHAGDRGRGVLREAHQAVLYKLYELWGQLGYPIESLNGEILGAIRLTAYQLVSALFPGDDSSRAYRNTKELLLDLKAIPIALEGVPTHDGTMDDRPFTLLQIFDWNERKVDKRTRRPVAGGTSSATIMFSRFITDAFRARHTRMLLGKPYDGLCGRGRRSVIARLLYPLLDRELATQDAYEAPLQELAKRYGLREYAERTRRRDQFASACRLLNGQLILEGKYRLAVELRRDRTDFVFCASRKRADTALPGS